MHTIAALLLAWVLLFSLPASAIKAEGYDVHVVRVGFFENRPKNYTNESGVRAGFYVAILEEIAKNEGWQLVYVDCVWTECLTMLEQGQLDLLPDVAISPERQARFTFHQEPVLESWAQVYHSPDSPIIGLADIRGHRITMHKGHVQRSHLERLAKGLGYTVDIVEVDSDPQAFALVAAGEADAAVVNEIFGNFHFRQYGLEKSPVVLAPVLLFYAADYGANSELLGAIDRHLQLMKGDPDSLYYNELGKLLQKPVQALLPAWVMTAINVLAVVVFLTLCVIALLYWHLRSRNTELKMIHEALAESEEKFRIIFMSQSAVKLIVEPGTGRIVEANPAAAVFYGWPLDELRKKRLQDISTSTPEELMDKCCRKLSSKQPGDLCVRFLDAHRTASDVIRDVEVFGSIIQIQGKPSHHYFIYDITEQKRLEEQYRQAQKMESVGRLAGGIAHDFNNVLGAVVGYAELAMDKVEKTDPVYADLEEIGRAAKRSAGIVRQLLAFARKQHGLPEVVNLNETVSSMVKMLSLTVGEDVTLLWVPEQQLWPIYIDPSQMEQVITNLCINASDAIHACCERGGTGTIRVETRLASFDADFCDEHPDFLPGDFVLLSVEDDGCGMEKWVREQIYDPFFTTKPEGEGTGLGLSMVYGIVKQAKGFLRVYSEPGKGSTFRIYFPRYVGQVAKRADFGAASDTPAVPATAGEQKLVLLVDDDLMMREVVEMQLQKLGYQVLAADTPIEAIRLASEHRKEIVLLVSDVVMPGMNGRDLSRKVREICPDIRVLFMSGYTADEVVRRDVLDAGVNFIQKPFSRKDLSDKVQRILYT